MRQGLRFKILKVMEKNNNDSVVANAIMQYEREYRASAVFIDAGYGQGVYSFGKTAGKSWILVQFGGKAFSESYANKRAEMYGSVKSWLGEGGCLPDDQMLADDLKAIETIYDKKGRVLLESKADMKKRGLPSPDRADALALSFAHPVMSRDDKYSNNNFGAEMIEEEYDPFKSS